MGRSSADGRHYQDSVAESCQEKSKVEEGREEEEEEEEGQEKKIKEILAGVRKEADAVGSGVTRNAVSEAQSTTDGEDLPSKSGLGVGRKVCGRLNLCRWSAEQ